MNFRMETENPCLSLHLSPSSSGQGAQNVESSIYGDLLEIGILLLEIWHEKTLEQHFALNQAPKDCVRQMLAFEWYEEARNALPECYLKAAFYCIADVKNIVPGHVHWDNMRLWETICENVIEPLLTLSKI